MAKVTHNSDKEADVFKSAEEMTNGEVGTLAEMFVIKIKDGGVVDLKDGYAIATTSKIRILPPDESITLRNE